MLWLIIEISIAMYRGKEEVLLRPALDGDGRQRNVQAQAGSRVAPWPPSLLFGGVWIGSALHAVTSIILCLSWGVLRFLPPASCLRHAHDRSDGCCSISYVSWDFT